MLKLNNILQYKSRMLIFGFLSITFALYACNVGVSTQEEVQDVEELRLDLSKLFSNLATALKISGKSQIDQETFKKESLKHLLEIDELNDNYDQISHNYNIGFASITNIQLAKNTEEVPAYFSHVENLSEFLIEVEDFESTRIVFENYYSQVVSEEDLTNEEKNVLISIGAWYEGSLNFFEQNSDLFYSENLNKSISDIKFKGCGWWKRWGKCVAGTIGGYYGGALGGCAVGAGVGAVAAGVGAIPGCAVGAAVGAIGGALTGAAASCDGCDSN